MRPPNNRRGGPARGRSKPAFKPRPVRRGQLISPFGVGSMNDFRNDEALMCAGLDDWFRSPPEPSLRIQEERLAARLQCAYFVKPPEFSEAEGGSKHKIPHVRFPLWHYCPRCFRMKKAALFGNQPVCLERSCTTSRFGRRMIPVRIVAVCENGHIEDFPFRAWIGCECGDEDICRMFFKAGRSAASLAGIKIECDVCKKKRSLAGAFDDDALRRISVSCSGAQPWLGRERGQYSCSETLKTVQRGGSNVYFPAVQSSIYIPAARAVESDEIRRTLDNPATWAAISSLLVDGKVSENICKALAIQAQVDPAALTAAAQARIDGAGTLITGVTEEDYRRQEYEVLCRGAGSPTDELFVERIEGSRYDWLGRFVGHVGLVRKLRETRVLTGFSRLKPKTDRSDPAVQPLSVERGFGWLPAIEVRGEGIFVDLNGEAIEEWLRSPAAAGRIQTLVGEYNARRVARGMQVRKVDARFMMIHTLAHLLIKELTFMCGYGSASLRERIYCNLDNTELPMNGLLIYTASGDSEGTLGGLVAQAAPGRFERIVQDALQRNAWCSNDPVCIESPGSGALSANLAACHGCVLMPETSCEEGNRLLDRGLVVGTIEAPDIGFFSSAPFRSLA